MLKKWLKRGFFTFLWVAFFGLALYVPNWLSSKSDEKSLTILTWGDILDPGFIADFEKRTGSKVRLNYYASNEELVVKLKATGGKGYDIIVPSDYAVSILSKYELLKPLDKSKLNFLDRINPKLLHHPFDPDNTYSLPFEWEIFGLGIDREYFSKFNISPSWKMVFRPDIPYSLVMTNDPIEAIQIASFYLFGDKTSLSDIELYKVQSLLIQQRHFIEAYATFRADYFLATRNCPIVVTTSSYIWRAKRQFPFVDFAIPEEGTFITIENLCMTKASTKEALVYRFLNELYSEASIRMHYETFGFLLATLHTASDLDLDDQQKALIDIHPNPNMPKLRFISELAPQEQIQNLWISVKASPL